MTKPEGCRFESQHHILDGHFLHLFVVKLELCVLVKTKIDEKEDGDCLLNVRFPVLGSGFDSIRQENLFLFICI